MSFKEKRLLHFQKGPDVLKSQDDSELMDDLQKAEDPEKDIQTLSAQEKGRMDNEGLSFQDIQREREIKRSEADNKLNSFFKKNTATEKVVDEDTYQNLQKELKEATNDKEIDEVMRKIDAIPENNDKAKQAEVSEKETVELKHPGIQEVKKDWENLFKNKRTVHLIGTKQVDEFKNYFEKGLKKSGITIENARKLLEDLKGEGGNTNKDGLHPRRQRYQQFETLFKEYRLGEPAETSDYIKQEGHSERGPFLENAKQAHQILRTTSQDLYTPKLKRQIMAQVLGVSKGNVKTEQPLAKTPGEQQEMVKLLTQIKDTEARNYIMIANRGSNSMQVGKRTIAKMSKSTMDTTLMYYLKNDNLQGRLDSVKDWPKLMEKEAKLSKDLEKIYKDDPEGLEKALDVWEKLDYFEKQKALPKHKKMVKESSEKEMSEREMIRDAGFEKIDKALKRQDISKTTADQYKEWFQEKGAKEPKEIDDLNKAFKLLTAPAGTKYSLADFKKNHEAFDKKLDYLQQVNPDIKDSEIKKWEDRYHEGGWKVREKVAGELENEVKEQEKSANQMDEADEKTKNVNVLGRPETPEQALEQAKSRMADQPLEALAVLTTFLADMREKQQEVPSAKKLQITNLMRAISYLIDAFGEGEASNDTMGEELEAKVKEKAASDATIQDKLRTQQTTTQKIEGAKMNERRHGNQKEAQARSEREVKQAAGSDEELKVLTDSYLDQDDDTHVLKKDKDGEIRSHEKDTIEMTDAMANIQAREHRRENLAEQTENFSKQIGLSDVEFKDRAGNKISAEQAGTEDQKNQEFLAADLADRVAQDLAPKVSKDTGLGTAAFNLADQVRLKRAAQEEVEERANERVSD